MQSVEDWLHACGPDYVNEKLHYMNASKDFGVPCAAALQRAEQQC